MPGNNRQDGCYMMTHVGRHVCSPATVCQLTCAAGRMGEGGEYADLQDNQVTVALSQVHVFKCKSFYYYFVCISQNSQHKFCYFKQEIKAAVFPLRLNSTCSNAKMIWARPCEKRKRLKSPFTLHANAPE